MGYSAPERLPEALRLIAGGDVAIICGGTDFYPALGTRRPPGKIMDVSGLAELRGISRGDGGWRIGAATSWSDITGADLPPGFDGLRAAAREVGSRQIQNAGTIGGNLCNASPAADGVVPLLTLDATLEVQSLGGTRFVPLADFITGVRRTDLAADELVVAIHVPAPPDRARGSFIKLGMRRYLVISIAMVSALIIVDGAGRIEHARVAVGACSPLARRLGGLEVALIGLNAAQLGGSADIWSGHLAPLSPIGDLRGTARYRLAAAGELCRRAVLAAMGEPGDE